MSPSIEIDTAAGLGCEDSRFPPVSVVIPTFNRSEVLCETIKLTLAQDYPDFEVIVVDQTPEPSAAVQELVERAGKRLRYLRRNVANLPAARNAAVRIARGDIIVFIDDDVVMGPDYLASHVARYRDTALGGMTGITLAPGLLPEDDETDLIKNRLGGGAKRLNNGCFETHSIEGCNCSFRREAIIRAGMFDERFTGSAWGEDTDLALRVEHLGYLLLLDPKIRLVHLALKNGGCGNRDSRDELVDREHHRLFLYYLLKNRKILGCTKVISTLWAVYRSSALNPETLTSLHLAVTRHERILGDLLWALRRIKENPLAKLPTAKVNRRVNR